MMVPGQNRDVAVALLSDAPLSQSQGLLLTLRSASNERAAAIMRAHLESHYQKELSDGLDGPNPVARAALLISICAGVELLRNVLDIRALRAGDTEAVADQLAAALDAVAAPAPSKPRRTAR